MKHPTTALLILLLAATAALGQYVEDSIYLGRGYVYDLAYCRSTTTLCAPQERLPGTGPVSIVDCATNTVIAQHYVKAATCVDCDTVRSKFYVSYLDSVLVLDASTGSRLAAIRMPDFGWVCDVAYDGRHGRIYVSDSDGEQVAIINCATDQLVGTIAVPEGPFRLHLSTARPRMYVLCGYGEALAIVDTDRNEVVRVLPMGDGGPGGGIYCPEPDRYVCEAADEMVVVDGAGDTVVRRTPMPRPSSFDPLVWVGEAGAVAVGIGDSAYVYDVIAGAFTGALPCGRQPSSLWWSRATQLLYGAGEISDNVVVTDFSGTRRRVLAVGMGPEVLQEAEAVGRVYVGHCTSRRLYVIRNVAGGAAEPGVRRPAGAEPAALTARPSAFAASTELRCAAAGRIAILDREGRVVRVLCSDGATPVRWDGRDEQGREVPAGVYVAAASAPGARAQVVKVR